MKDYLKCSLSDDEKDLIIGMIWRTAKTFKQRLYEAKVRKSIPIEEIEIFAEDDYEFGNKEAKLLPRVLHPLSVEEKNRIVDYIDSLLSELLLNEFKVALTFEEKLVLFLCIFQKYSRKDTAIFLGTNIYRVKYIKEKFKNKKYKYLGEM